VWSDGLISCYCWLRNHVPNLVMRVISSLEPTVPLRTGGEGWAVGDLGGFQGLAADLA